MDKAREQSIMEKEYRVLLKEGRPADAMQPFSCSQVFYCWVIYLFILMSMSFLFGGSRTNTYTHKNQFILESLSGQKR